MNNDTIVIENIFPFQEKHCHGSTITALPNGDLLAAWFQGSGERTADDVAIMGSKYKSSTGRWSSPFVMADVPGFPDINPVLFVDKTDRLWLVWYTVMAYQWESSILKYRISENYMQDSTAPEWKWQDMIHVKPDGSTPDGIGKNDPFVKTLKRKYEEYYHYLDSAGYLSDESGKPLRKEIFDLSFMRYLSIARGTNLISNGTDTDDKGEKVKTRLGYPLMRRIGWQTRNKPLFSGNKMLLPLYSDGFDFSLVAITGDGGKTWEFSEPLLGAGAVQPTLVQRKDGVIEAWMRDNGPAPQRLMVSLSSDTGKTWSIARDSKVPNPGSAADMAVLKSGNWVFVGNDTDDGRNRLSVWLSYDEGKTWPHRMRLVDAPQGGQTRAHYPAIIQDAYGMIHISFTNQVPSAGGGSNVKNIAHAVFSEGWLMK
jgi:predicted neuraminidase